METTMNNNVNIFDLPTKISKDICCAQCGKGYKTKTNYEKHLILCGIISKGNQRSNDEEMLENLPSQKMMYKMILELGQKYNRLEEKMNEVNKWVVKKKKKIDVIEWLNTTIKPEYIFDELIDKIYVTDANIEFMFNNTVYDTYNSILENPLLRNPLLENPLLKNPLFKKVEQNFGSTFDKGCVEQNFDDKGCVEQNFDDKGCVDVQPIFAFIQKPGLLYAFISNEGDGVWAELPRDKLVRFLKLIHLKITRALFEWKKNHLDNIYSSDSVATMFDKTTSKLMAIDFKQEHTLSRFKNIMYSRLKTDVKTMIEYEFE